MVLHLGCGPVGLYFEETFWLRELWGGEEVVTATVLLQWYKHKANSCPTIESFCSLQGSRSQDVALPGHSARLNASSLQPGLFQLKNVSGFPLSQYWKPMLWESICKKLNAGPSLGVSHLGTAFSERTVKIDSLPHSAQLPPRGIKLQEDTPKAVLKI